MLSLMLCEPEAGVRRQLLAAMESSCRALHVPLQVLGQTEDPKEAEECIQGEDGVLVLMLTVEQSERITEKLRLAHAVYRRNRDNYVLLLLKTLSQLEQFVNLNLRPAGVLVKPLAQEKVDMLVNRIVQDYQALHVQQQQQLVLQIGGGIRRIPVSSVLYVEAQNKKLSFVTATQCISTYWVMQKAEEALGNRFQRCHRSFLVNLDAVEEADFAQMEVHVSGGHRLPISRSAKEALRQALMALQ